MGFISSLFGGGKKPPAPPKPPSTSSAQIQAAELAARQRAMGARGRGATILTPSNNLGNVG